MLDVHVNPSNPRIIKDDKFKKLCKSIKEFPKMLELRPIIVDKTGLILGGNMRFKAIQELGLELKPEWVKVGELSPEEQRRFIVEDNVGFGEWDWDALANEYEKEELEEWGMDVDKWVDNEVVEDEVPEVTDNPISKLGEVYQLGRHRIMCGDSTKIEDVEKLMDGKKADMVFTDPPYGMDLDTDYSKLKGTSKSPNAKGYKWDKVIGDDKEFNFTQFQWLDTPEQFWWGADYYFNQLPVGGSLAVWQKRDKADAEMIGNDFEICWSKQQHKKTTFWKRWVGFDSIEKGEKRVHPTQKPTELARYFIKEYSEDESLILDLFLGSGSTLIACEQTNRICYGMEISPQYIDVCRKRYAKFIGKEDEWETLTPRIQS